ncbi:MAG: SusC/RagA family TonB-linked outer membrane protein [Gemmatimonadetes bacterium]|nr:SusC/RagA family TonB-linked outer membrane protein [Gemmatimonadota bacterium]
MTAMVSRLLPSLTVALSLCGTWAGAAVAQNRTESVAGVVEDERSNPIANARVVVAGTTLQTFTDRSGRFRLDNVDGGSAVQLRVSIIGYRPATLDAQVGDTDVRVVMAAAAVSLDEIVVTGTAGGTQMRAIGNVVATVDAAKVLATTPTPNVEQLLSARTPGVMVLPATGQVGTGGPLRIRGTYSMSLINEPIVIIDGVRMYADPRQGPRQLTTSRVSRLQDLNPEDIQSIEIIKGPSAATLYGTEASNGVIQIITKRGATGKPHFDVTLRRGSNWMVNPGGRTPLRWWRDATTGELLSVNLYERERLQGTGSIFQNGLLQGYSANLRGGTDVVRYFASASYDDDEGVVSWNWDKRFSTRLNLDLTLAERLSARMNMGFVDRATRLAQTGYSTDPFSNLIWGNPLNLNNPLKGYFFSPPSEWAKVESRADNERVTASLELRYSPLSWLAQRLSTGIDLNDGKNWVLHPRQAEGSAHFWGQNGLGSKQVENVTTGLLTVDYSGSAKVNVVPNALALTTSVGFQYYKRETRSITADGRIFPALPITTVSGGATRTSGESFEENATVGLYLQQQVDWRNRVFLTGAVRGDDNSAFGAEYDAAIYPKLSATWVVHEEPFWPLSWVDQLKLRAAWGAAGQQPGTFDAARLFDPEVGFQDRPVLVPGAYGNPQLKPERSEELEYGFDVSLLGGRVELNATRYHRWIKDAIVRRPVPPSSGFFGDQIVNLAGVRGWGNELGINARLISKPRFGWDFGVQIATNGNRIDDLGGLEFISAGGRQEHRPGYPVGAIFVKDIRSATIDATGLVTSAMCDGGTGTIGLDRGGPAVDCAVAPRVFWAPSTPTWQLGINTSLSIFQNLTLYARVEGFGGHHTINTEMRASHNNGITEPTLRRDDVMVQATRAIENDVMGLYNGAFAKLREVSLTYTLPALLLRSVRASRGSVTVAGRNLMMLWTGHYGFGTPRDGRVPQANEIGGEWTWDPELRNPSQVQSDYTVYLPPTTSATVTVRLSF